MNRRGRNFRAGDVKMYEIDGCEVYMTRRK